MSQFKVLVGERINGIFTANDRWSLIFRTTEGKWHRFDTENDCCNSVWFNHITGTAAVGDGNVFDLLRGAVVTGVEDKGWGENRDNEDGYEVVQDGFWTIKTDRGYIDIEVRNSHNGYYGGSVAYNDNGVDDITDMEEVKEDF